MNRADAIPDPETSSNDLVSRTGADGDNDSHAPHGSLRDLAVLLALPAMWVGHEPSYIVEDLLSVLFSLLRLESAYVRFDDPSGSPALEYWKPSGSSKPSRFEPAIASEPPPDRGLMTVVTSKPSGVSSQGALRTAKIFPALPGEDGLVLAESTRPDFPTDHERYLLRVAVGQATISLRAARMLASERAARIAAEAALETRNAFLANLAQDLTASMETVAYYTTQSRVLSLESQGEADSPRGTTPSHYHDALPAASNGLRAHPESPEAPISVPLAIHLTRRETEVLGLLAQGLSNKEIAAELWLSDRTVERHITGLYAKIGVRRRTEATLYALQQGLEDIVAGDA